MLHPYHTPPPSSQVPQAEKVLQRERAETLKQLRKRSSDLSEACEALDAGLATARKQVGAAAPPTVCHGREGGL